MFSDPKVRKAYIWTIFAFWVAFVVFSIVISTQRIISQNRTYDARAERDSTRPAIQTHNRSVDEVLDSLDDLSGSFDESSNKPADPDETTSSLDGVYVVAVHPDETTAQPQRRKVTPYRESLLPFIMYIIFCVIFTIPLVHLAVNDKLLKLVVCETIFLLIQMFSLLIMVLPTYTYLVH